MTTEIKSLSRFFKIKGGETVLEAKGHVWIRWDRWDGPVQTSIWTLDHPSLEEIPEAEARVILGAIGR